MPRAVWKNTTIAESNACVVVEGNQYFPPSAVRADCLRPSDTHTVCHWKGTASYFDVIVGTEVNKDAAWCYPDTKPEAKHIEGYIAFWKGVNVDV